MNHFSPNFSFIYGSQIVYNEKFSMVLFVSKLLNSICKSTGGLFQLEKSLNPIDQKWLYIVILNFFFGEKCNNRLWLNFFSFNSLLGFHCILSWNANILLVLQVMKMAIKLSPLKILNYSENIGLAFLVKCILSADNTLLSRSSIFPRIVSTQNSETAPSQHL